MQNFPKNKHFLPPLCVSGDKKCSFFGKFGMLCFLVTPVFRFAYLPYQRHNPLWMQGWKICVCCIRTFWELFLWVWVFFCKFVAYFQLRNAACLIINSLCKLNVQYFETELQLIFYSVNVLLSVYFSHKTCHLELELNQ